MALVDKAANEATRWVGPPDQRSGNKTYYSSFRRFGERFKVGEQHQIVAWPDASPGSPSFLTSDKKQPESTTCHLPTQATPHTSFRLTVGRPSSSGALRACTRCLGALQATPCCNPSVVVSLVRIRWSAPDSGLMLRLSFHATVQRPLFKDGLERFVTVRWCALLLQRRAAAPSFI